MEMTVMRRPIASALAWSTLVMLGGCASSLPPWQEPAECVEATCPYDTQVSDDAPQDDAPDDESNTELEVPTTLELTLASDNDDAEELLVATDIAPEGQVKVGSDDLELANDRSRGIQLIGLRFPNAAIPPGVDILAAELIFTSDAAGSETTNLVISGELSPNATEFVAQSQNLSTRAQTLHAISWTPPEWTASDVSGVAQTTPDVSVLVQDIVDQPAWQAGNALALFLSGSGVRTAVSFDEDPGRAPRLVVTYAAAQ